MNWNTAVARVLKVSGIIFMLLEIPGTITIAQRYWQVRGTASAQGEWFFETLMLKLVPIAHCARTLVIGFGAIGIALLLENLIEKQK